jgi:hypothetical protein
MGGDAVEGRRVRGALGEARFDVRSATELEKSEGDPSWLLKPTTNQSHETRSEFPNEKGRWTAGQQRRGPAAGEGEWAQQCSPAEDGR